MTGIGLRPLVYGTGGAVAAGGLFLLAAGCGLGIGLRLLLAGLILVGALAAERWRYRRLADEPPGRGFLATGERFVDPESGRPVTVYYHPETGERRYVGG